MLGAVLLLTCFLEGKDALLLRKCNIEKSHFSSFWRCVSCFIDVLSGGYWLVHQLLLACLKVL